jgi:hypothetical protein
MDGKPPMIVVLLGVLPQVLIIELAPKIAGILPEIKKDCSLFDYIFILR